MTAAFSATAGLQALVKRPASAWPASRAVAKYDKPANVIESTSHLIMPWTIIKAYGNPSRDRKYVRNQQITSPCDRRRTSSLALNCKRKDDHRHHTKSELLGISEDISCQIQSGRQNVISIKKNPTRSSHSQK